MDIIEVNALSVRAVVLRLRHRTRARRFTFYPMVHVAEPQFYEAVASHLAEHDLVVTEGFHGNTRQVQLLTWTWRFAGGSRRLGLVRQPRNLSDGVPTICPDMTAAEFRRRWGMLPLRERLVVWTMAPLFALWMRVSLSRRVLARFVALDDDIIIAQAEWNLPELEKLLTDERDALLIDALSKICADHEHDSLDVAVVYGAGHVSPAIAYLTAIRGYVVVGGDWLTVFDL